MKSLGNAEVGYTDDKDNIKGPSIKHLCQNGSRLSSPHRPSLDGAYIFSPKIDPRQPCAQDFSAIYGPIFMK